MRTFHIVEQTSFLTSVSAGALAAVAGGLGWTVTSVIAGCIAALAPIAGRLASNRLTGPRTITSDQAATLARVLGGAPPFKIWVAHNMEEAEPSAFHAAMVAALKAAGLDVQWFGGLNNNAVGMSVSGPDGPQRALLIKALNSAKIPFQLVVFADKEGSFTDDVAIWIGTHPK